MSSVSKQCLELCKNLLLLVFFSEEEKEEEEFGVGDFKFHVPLRYPGGILEVRD